jgi:hypothetical protein
MKNCSNLGQMADNDLGSIETPGNAFRDDFQSLFRAVGRVMYAKRTGDRMHSFASPLTFNPDETVARSGLSPISFFSFVSENAPALFTDAVELAKLCDAASDADVLSTARWNDPTRAAALMGSFAVQSGAFPDGYVASLAGRSVACFNRTPAKRRFRQIMAPEMFAVNRAACANTAAVASLFPKLFRRVGPNAAIAEMLPLMATMPSQYRYRNGCCEAENAHWTGVKISIPMAQQEKVLCAIRRYSGPRVAARLSMKNRPGQASRCSGDVWAGVDASASHAWRHATTESDGTPLDGSEVRTKRFAEVNYGVGTAEELTDEIEDWDSDNG